MLRYLFSFEGRIRRIDYWRLILIAAGFVLAAALLLLPMRVVEGRELSDLAMPLSLLDYGTLAMILVMIIALVIANAAVSIRRLHDRNKSALWFVLYVLVPPILNFILPRDGETPDPLGSLYLLAALIGLGLSVAGFVEMGLLRGTVGDNRYGPDPLA